ncbi:MAG: hypothetical protein ACETWK_13900 [Candidatus Aminicenantaceae bacterium]
MKRILSILFVIILTLSGIFAQEDEILKLKVKIIEIQNKNKLGFNNFTLCSNIISFASYVPLPEPVVEKDGTLLIYYEPANVFTSKKNGLYEIWYTQDMSLLSEEGKLLFEKKDALSFHYTTKIPIMDLYATNTLTLTGLSPGKYKFKATLKDKLRGKTAIKIVDFEIR